MKKHRKMKTPLIASALAVALLGNVAEAGSGSDSNMQWLLKNEGKDFLLSGNYGNINVTGKDAFGIFNGAYYSNDPLDKANNYLVESGSTATFGSIVSNYSVRGIYSNNSQDEFRIKGSLNFEQIKSTSSFAYGLYSASDEKRDDASFRFVVENGGSVLFKDISGKYAYGMYFYAAPASVSIYSNATMTFESIKAECSDISRPTAYGITNASRTNTNYDLNVSGNLIFKYIEASSTNTTLTDSEAIGYSFDNVSRALRSNLSISGDGVIEFHDIYAHSQGSTFQNGYYAEAAGIGTSDAYARDDAKHNFSINGRMIFKKIRSESPFANSSAAYSYGAQFIDNVVWYQSDYNQKGNVIFEDISSSGSSYGFVLERTKETSFDIKSSLEFKSIQGLSASGLVVNGKGSFADKTLTNTFKLQKDKGKILFGDITSSPSGVAYGLAFFDGSSSTYSYTTFRGSDNEKDGGIIVFDNIAEGIGSSYQSKIFYLSEGHSVSMNAVRMYYGDYAEFDASHRAALYANLTGTYTDKSGASHDRHKQLNYTLSSTSSQNTSLITSSEAVFEGFESSGFFHNSSRWLIDTDVSGNLYGMYFKGEVAQGKAGTVKISSGILSTEGFGRLNSERISSSLQSDRNATLIYTEGDLTLDLSSTTFASGLDHSTLGASVEGGNGKGIGLHFGATGEGTRTVVRFKKDSPTFAKITGNDAIGIMLDNGSNVSIQNLAIGGGSTPAIDGKARSIGIFVKSGTSTLDIDISNSSPANIVLKNAIGGKEAYGVYLEKDAIFKVSYGSSMLNVNNAINGTNKTVGVYFQGSQTDRINLGNLGSEQSNFTYGFYLDGGENVSDGTQMQDIIAKYDAYGMYNKNASLTLRDIGQHRARILLNNIKSGGSAYGFKGESDTLSGHTNSLDFALGNIVANGDNAYGVYLKNQNLQSTQLIAKNITSGGKAGVLYMEKGTLSLNSVTLSGNVVGGVGKEFKAIELKGLAGENSIGNMQFSGQMGHANSSSSSILSITASATDASYTLGDLELSQNILSDGDVTLVQIDTGSLKSIGNISAKNIRSGNDAHALVFSNLSHSEKATLGTVQVNDIYANGNAYGVSYISSGALQAQSLTLGNITASVEKAYALQIENSNEENKIASLQVKDISGGNAAYGIELLNSNLTVEGNTTFGNIQSTSGSLYGILSTGSSLSIAGNTVFGDMVANGDVKVISSHNGAIHAGNVSIGNITNGVNLHLKVIELENLTEESALGDITLNGALGNQNGKVSIVSYSNSDAVKLTLGSIQTSQALRASDEVSILDITGGIVEQNGTKVISVSQDLTSSEGHVYALKFKNSNGSSLGAIEVGNISAKQGAYGLSLSGSNLGVQSLRFGDISVNGDRAIASAVSLSNNSTLTLKSSVDLSLQNITSFGADGKAYGILIDSSSLVLMDTLKLGNISASNGSAYALSLHDADFELNTHLSVQDLTASTLYGISHTGTGTLSFKARGSAVFGTKTGSQSARIYNGLTSKDLRFDLSDTVIEHSEYGFFTQDQAKSLISLASNKTLTFNATGTHEGDAFAGNNELALNNQSSVIFNSNGGMIQKVSSNATNAPTINLAGNTARNASSLALRSLEIKDLNAKPITFMVHANTDINIASDGFTEGRTYIKQADGGYTQEGSIGGSDRIVITGSSAKAPQNHTLALGGADNSIINVGTQNNQYLVLAEVKGEAKDRITFNNLSNGSQANITNYAGFERQELQLRRKDAGANAYYYIVTGMDPNNPDDSDENIPGGNPDSPDGGGNPNGGSNPTINEDYLAPTLSAMLNNYDLFLANFNSLNKRMGELRDNPKEHGVWVRIFGGRQVSDFGVGNENHFITTQAGYDYSFACKDANNYLGFALSYMYSNSNLGESQYQVSPTDIITGSNKGVSHGFEFALYNAYVGDSGWYSDTIAKFAYLQTDLTIFNQSNNYKLSNFGFVFSEEVGYRYKFGSNKNFYFDPQLEVAFGNLSEDGFTQSLQGTKTAYTLSTSQNDIFMLRTRVGASIGYFSPITKANGEKLGASIYLGAFYEYDYLKGGEVSYQTKHAQINNHQDLQSNGRAVLNVGTNILLTKESRIYIDVEKSFDGKTRTDFKVNAGVRISFGERKMQEETLQTQEKPSEAPLKIEEQSKEFEK